MALFLKGDIKMNELKLYYNRKPYPYYNEGSLTTIKTFQVTPFNQNLKSGYVDLQLSDDDITEFNYLSYKKGSTMIYGWVDDVEKLSRGLSYRVHFSVDAFRTYKGSIDLDVQWVKRDMNETRVQDGMLSGLTPTDGVDRYESQFDDAGTRTIIIQVREDSDVPFPYDGVYNDLPLQPAPYSLYMSTYDSNEWVTSASTPLVQLMQALGSQAQTTNIVTMYSVPGDLIGPNSRNDSITLRYANEDGLFSGIGATNEKEISGFYRWHSGLMSFTKDSIQLPQISGLATILRSKHTVRVVVPGAGIMAIPDDMLLLPNLSLTRYADVYSGACSYVLEAGNPLKPYDGFIRQAGMSSIPILSSVMDSYISQNQNAMMTQIIGDVAMLGGSIAGSVATGGSATPFLLPGMLASGKNLVGAYGNIADANRQPPSNPPAMLNNTLAPHFDGIFYMLVTRTDVENEAQIHLKYGYPQNISKALNFPLTGFIQLQGCNIKTLGNIPLWAINEINDRFDNGLFFE